ncbi:MAG: adenylate/guanylate cyclase domain-containing protein [Kiloniellales bacterium]|nr:adenylate/guanylate cyclase domain-containing protein [Kiloniellales bacterium]
MTETSHTHETLQILSGLHDWIVTSGLAGKGGGSLIEGYCRRLGEAGVPLDRCAFGLDTLHPVLIGSNFIWSADAGIAQRDYERSEAEAADELWLQSPFHYLAERKETRLRLKPGDALASGLPQFPILEELKAAGATDYLVLLTPLSGNEAIGDFDTVYSSWTTLAPAGFSDHQLALIEGSLPSLCLALKSALTRSITDTLMRTYLGDDAGQRVLSGKIERGTAESIKAVLWYSDLRGFTRIADTAPSETLLGLLNDYAACVVETLHAHNGQVLKFVGDGILAIFKLADARAAGEEALDAAEALLACIDALNAQREAAGLPTSDIYLALHLGEVLYGNIGSLERLDFTVVGPAVNEVSRIEGLCRNLDQRVLVSSDFAAGAPAARPRLVSLGRYALRGVAEPQELFTLEPR